MRENEETLAEHSIQLRLLTMAVTETQVSVESNRSRTLSDWLIQVNTVQANAVHHWQISNRASIWSLLTMISIRQLEKIKRFIFLFLDGWEEKNKTRNFGNICLFGMLGDPININLEWSLTHTIRCRFLVTDYYIPFVGWGTEVLLPFLLTLCAFL